MEPNNNSFDEKSINERRRQKVQNFHVHIDSDDLAVGERYRQLENLDDPEAETINSYSDDDVKEKMRKNSRTMLKEERKKLKKQQHYTDRLNRRKFRFIWWASVVLVGCMLAVFLMVGVSDMLAMNRTESNTVTVKIPEAPTLEDVSSALSEKGVIGEPAFFNMYASITKNSDRFSQGTYDISTNMDYEAIINYLQSMANRTDTVKITLREGMNVIEIADALKEKGILSDTDKFLKLCNSDEFDEDYEFLANMKNPEKRYYKLEGYLFPDTYECYVNEDPEITINRMLNDYEIRVYSDQTVEGYKNDVNIKKLAKKTDYSLNQILIMASIIQAEAANADDMYYISSIIHNRLEYSADYGVSKLGLDCTKFYPYRSKKQIPEEQKKTFKSTYNTYKFDGLPPGPICNPGMEAILAAIYPNSTDYLYFCHDRQGNPYYASTLYQQNINLASIGS